MIPIMLVLASSSLYRRALLARLGLPFETAAPDIDEEPSPNEPSRATAARLAHAKAAAVAARFPAALIIGSDQAAVCEGQTLNKPGGHDAAVRQLRLVRGRTVEFYTALCVLNAATGRAQSDIATVAVRFRNYNDAQIERYLRAEQPYDCAGSAKVEGLGIALAERIDSDDPTALIGLPLIRLVSMLHEEGIAVP